MSWLAISNAGSTRPMLSGRPMQRIHAYGYARSGTRPKCSSRGCRQRTNADTQAVEIVALLERGIATAKPTLPEKTIVEFQHDPDVGSIECEPVQIEQVVVQLLRNAASASCEFE